MIKLIVIVALIALSKQAADFKCPGTEAAVNCDSAIQFCNASNVCTNTPAHGAACVDKSATIANGSNCPASNTCTTVGTDKKCLKDAGQACAAHTECAGFCNSTNNQCAAKAAYDAACTVNEGCTTGKCDTAATTKLCVTALKGDCTTNSKCGTGAACTANKCLLSNNQTCAANDECVTAICDTTKKCVAKDGDACDATTNLCKATSKCDTTTNKCVALAAAGAACTKDADCTSAKCESSKCVIKEGADCTGNTDKCLSGYECKDNKCAKKASSSNGEIKYFAVSAIVAIAAFFI
uniref:Ciliary protein n=1 Tax=Miamiensis avidus TaxID=279580 RepID=A0A2Z5U9Y9_MIAAV|nr:ciliary protein [Miamiensis avidus]